MISFGLAVPLLLALTASARTPHRRSPMNTDTCANLRTHLVFQDVLIGGKPYDAGLMHLGLCVSQVPVVVNHYSVTQDAAKVVGEDKVQSVVTSMIKTVGMQCFYPPHARSSVTDGDECGFVCTDGFLAMPPSDPTSCTCPSHLKECNGKCGHFHSDCTTRTSPPPSRRQHNSKCATDLTMCGVPDATWSQAYKCTDVTSDSYSCGGCVKAPPFGSTSTGGVNCHKLPNVDEVSCNAGKCIVHTCKTGFTVMASNDGCVADPHAKIARDVPVPSPSPWVKPSSSGSQ